MAKVGKNSAICKKYTPKSTAERSEAVSEGWTEADPEARLGVLHFGEGCQREALHFGEDL